jgi:hypothetical protein
VQELPGLLKRYKDGVPGWELKATNLDEVIAGRDVVPRDELLARVREASPVYTHGEVVLGGRPQTKQAESLLRELDESPAPPGGLAGDGMLTRPDYQFPDTGEASRLGRGVSHGKPRYESYGQGGQDYAELLLTQPRVGDNYGSHWGDDTKDVVAHARFDTHGDALRINELQSDLGIHNRKARERAASGEPPVPAGWADTGSPRSGEELPFPLEDAWSDLLIKRLALEAARQGHRAIEVASPRAIADKVGGNIDNYEHFYGKVVPGALERLGRKMGGLVEEVPGQTSWTMEPWDKELSAIRNDAMQSVHHESDAAYRALVNSYFFQEGPEIIVKRAEELASRMHPAYSKDMPRVVAIAEREALARRAHREARKEHQLMDGVLPPARRYIMSDEMRRRIIEQGIGASVLAPLLMQDE